MPVPICRTVKAAYDAGRADAPTGMPAASPEVVAKVAELLAPWLQELVAAARPTPRLLTIAEAAGQLGVDRRTVYDLVHKGDIATIQIPPRIASRGERHARRIEQAEIDAFIERNRVKGPVTPGGW
jgi:excisionase family DNA binding protein